MAKKVYILSEEMRSSKSGFYIEGTDLELDYPDEYPLPMETEVLEGELPVSLRILPHCKYLEKERQIKEGYPPVYKYTDVDRKKLTFKHSRLILDDKRDRMWIEFVERTGWMEGNEAKKLRNNTRTIYKFYDEDALIEKELELDTLITRAKMKVLDLSTVELKDLYRLAVGGHYNDATTSLKQMRKYLMNVAQGNAAFIMEGVSSTRDKVVILLNKAMGYKILAMEYPGQVMYKSESTGEYVPLVAISEAQGSVGKFNKFVDYLMTDAGQTELAVIESKVNELDEEEGAAQEPQDAGLFSHEETSRKRKK